MDPLERLAQRLAERTGLDLSRGGRSHSFDRFVRARAEALGFGSVDAYVDARSVPDDPELDHIANAVTVGHTWFYRDSDEMHLLDAILRELPGPPRTLQVWVPACATGEDAYSIALLARRAGRNVAILGTDLNSEFIESARLARYGAWSLRELPPDLASDLLPRENGLREIPPTIRACVEFRRHNLVDTPPAPHGEQGWDLVLCRNVLFYFLPRSVHATVERIGRVLAPDGWLLLGASEVLRSWPPGLVPVRRHGRVALRLAGTARNVVDRRGPSRGEQRLRRHTPSLAAIAVPDGASEILARGGACLAAGQIDGALLAYVQASELNPLSADARLLGGIAHHLAGDAASAIRVLRGALLLDPDLWPAMYYLAVSYDALNRTDEARREYRRVFERLSTAPPSPIEHAFLADIHALREDLRAVAGKRAAASVPGGVR